MSCKPKFNKKIVYIKPIPYIHHIDPNRWHPVTAQVPFKDNMCMITFRHLPDLTKYQCNITQNTLYEIIKEDTKYKRFPSFKGLYHNIEILDLHNIKRYKMYIHKDFSITKFRKFFLVYDKNGNQI
jgi:hypothetical protein